MAAVPGIKGFHMDNALSSETRQSALSSIEAIVGQARSSLLNTIIETKDRALQAHRLQCTYAYVLSVCRDRMIDSVIQMGFTMDTLTSKDLHDIIRALCHLRFQLDESQKRAAWQKVQASRQEQKRASTASAAMDTTSDLAPAVLNESIEKLIAKQVSAQVNRLSKNFKSLSVASSSSSSRRAPPSSGSGSRGGSSSRGSSRGGSSRPGAPHSRPSKSSSGSKSSSSGKGSRPVGPRTPSGRINKGASGPTRLAPGPTPFTQLKGKGNNHKRG
jgi:hypothetical protein